MNGPHFGAVFDMLLAGQGGLGSFMAVSFTELLYIVTFQMARQLIPVVIGTVIGMFVGIALVKRRFNNRMIWAAYPASSVANGILSALTPTTRDLWINPVFPILLSGVVTAVIVVLFSREEGHGRPQNGVNPLTWYRAGADKGIVSAQLKLATLYDKGIGVPQDHVQAAQWYGLAAEQGNPAAQYRLGLIFEQGRVVQQDLVLAHMWFNLAAGKGESKASSSRREIEEKMTAEEMVEAQKLAVNWKPNLQSHSAESSANSAPI